MAWCPKCKNEYRDGVVICADCGCELVTEEQYDDLVPLIFGDEEQMNSLKKYLEFNKLKGVTLSFSEEDGVFELLVREQDKGPANAMAKVFLQQEAMAKETEACGQEAKENDESDFQISEETQNPAAEEEREDVRPTVYLNNTERAEENRSSAWMLLIMGTIGLVAMFLGMLDVIPLRLGNPYMFYGVMCTVFILFIIMGVVSMKNAKLFAKKAESENTLRDAMTKWYQENLNADSINAELGVTEDVTDEVIYFKRVQIIKDKFNCQFMNLDQDFLEHYIDDEVYDAVFSDEE